MTKGLRWIAVAIVLAMIAAFVTGRMARARARVALAAETMTDARLRAVLLDSEIARFRLVPLALRDDRDVAAALAGRPGGVAALNRKLEDLARRTGASAIYLVDRRGQAVAASNWRMPYSFVGSNFGFRPYFRDALRDGAATQFARGTVSRRPGLFLAGRTPGNGVIAVKLDFDRVEADWRHAGGDTFVRNGQGIVLVTSRPDWRFATTMPLPAASMASFSREASLLPGMLQRLPAAAIGGVRRSVPTAQPGWTLTLRRDDAAVVRTASRAAAGGAAFAMLALVAIIWGMRQRVLLTRRRTAGLEEAVAARTAALTREIEERAASEARAAELREGLRQANRLATLGQVTASVAHETAQPVAAIRTYARTTASLLDAGDEAAVRENLDAIGRLADRIGVVTGELRGFARRGAGAMRPVPLAEVVDGALLILKDQLRAVTLHREPVDPALLVMGGRVRLEQVVVNLIQNAIEALAGRADGWIAVRLVDAGPHMVLAIEDNGPGVAPEVAERLFTPFVTSRAAGLGLGLVIARDIMTDFDGFLRLAPAAAGARFEVGMRRA